MINELNIEGVFEIIPNILNDARGSFTEIYRSSLLKEVNLFPAWKQFNTSTSKLNAIRGLHYGMYPEPHSKLVTCVLGRALDIVLDIRVGSPTFGKFEYLILDSEKRNSIYVPDGFAHAFQSLDENTTLNYLVTNEFNPKYEECINPISENLDLPWISGHWIISDKDKSAPNFFVANQSNRLPIYEAS